MLRSKALLKIVIIIVIVQAASASGFIEAGHVDQWRTRVLGLRRSGLTVSVSVWSSQRRKIISKFYNIPIMLSPIINWHV